MNLNAKFPILIFLTMAFAKCQKSDTNEVVLAKPEIIDFVPASGPPNTAVTISGINITGVKEVSFNGEKAFFQIKGDKIITEVPEFAKTGPITLETSGGIGLSKVEFIVTASKGATAITNILPNNNPSEWPVMIEGENIDKVVSVKFNNLEAVIDTNFTGVVTTRVPKNLPAGKVNVTVLSENGLSNKLSFTVLAVPPPGLKPPNKIVFKKKAKYSPVINNNWANEYGSGAFFMTDNGNGSLDDGLGNYWPMKVYVNYSLKTVRVEVNRDDNEFNDYYDLYIGEYVESDDPDQVNPTRQRIIFTDANGRQVVVGVKVK